MEFDAKTVAVARYGRCVQLAERKRLLLSELEMIDRELERLVVPPDEERNAFYALYEGLAAPKLSEASAPQAAPDSVTP